MNHGKHVTPGKVFTSTNFVPKYLEEKIEATTSAVSV
jgi:hypothetical protein